MGTRNKKKPKKVNLLETPNPERMQLIKKIRENLQHRIIETRLWQSLLETESITINGNIVYRQDEQLSGFSP